MNSSGEAVASPLPASVESALLARGLFWLGVAVAAGLMWLAPHLPMVDLPQHAGQVALWRDLLLGQSSWADDLRINYLTPYLIGYGLTLPLSFVMAMDDAVRAILSTSLVAFVFAAVALRRQLAGDPRLDWLFLFGFFGFAWKWGFLTFLVAAPVGLLFLLTSLRHHAAPSRSRALAVIVCGVALLFSHGLLCIIALFLAGCLWLHECVRVPVRSAIGLLPPYVALALICLGFRLVTAQLDGAMQFDRIVFGEPLWLRPLALVGFVSDMGLEGPLLLPLVTLLMFAAPWAIGCRINRGPGLALFVGLLIVLAALPSIAFQTSFLYQRFALFLMPFYALLFRAPEDAAQRNPVLQTAVLAGAAAAMLATQATEIRNFAAESADFDQVLAAASPGKRALSLVFERGSEAAANPYVYLHHAAWYQAEKHGFVDFNFAVFHPQIVRFRPGHVPEAGERFGWSPQAFDWKSPEAGRYDYFFVRGSPQDIETFRNKAPCPALDVAHAGRWALLAWGTCRP